MSNFDYLIIPNFLKIEGLKCDVSEPTEQLSEINHQLFLLKEKATRINEVHVVMPEINKIAPIVLDCLQKYNCKINHIKGEFLLDAPVFIFSYEIPKDLPTEIVETLNNRLKNYIPTNNRLWSSPRILSLNSKFFKITLDRNER